MQLSQSFFGIVQSTAENNEAVFYDVKSGDDPEQEVLGQRQVVINITLLANLCQTFSTSASRSEATPSDSRMD